MMNDSAEKLKIISSLREAGFVVEMDDFGSGYSSLNMLNNTPVDIIKIDMLFLRNIQDQMRTTTILHNMVNMMTELGLPSIVEGVETQDQCDFLSQIGCSYFQGYLFARPISVEEFEGQFLSSKV